MIHIDFATVDLPPGLLWFTDSQQTNGAGFTWRDERDVQMLGPRSVDNYMMHFVFKYTQNANGIPTVVFEKPTTKCVG